jgi:phosphate transport system permease protein
MDPVAFPFEVSERRGWRKAKSMIVAGLCLTAAVATVAPLALVLWHLLEQGFSSINWQFFTELPKPVGEKGGGMANAIGGTLVLLGLASAMGIPVGVLGGLFLSEYGTPRVNWLFRFAADVVNGVPSIIWGVVVWRLMVRSELPYPVWHDAGIHLVWKRGFSAYAGGIALGLMMIPLIMRSTEEVLLLVPNGYREAAVALGVARWRVSLQVFTYAISADEEWQRQAWAGALVLMALSLGLNAIVRLATRRPHAMT